MVEGVAFWLDNKNAVGTKVASLCDQVLVNYRNRFYIVADGAAVVKGNKVLRYSQSTLPADWKMILREETAPTGASAEVLPSAELAKPIKPPVTSEAPKTDRKTAPVSNTAVTPSIQTAVPVECPYCSHRQDISVEKGIDEKPFFQNCDKCSGDFAVRFVVMTTYQAQVAGFR